MALRRKRFAFRMRMEPCTPFAIGKDDALMPSLLTLSDVMGTGHHAAVIARVGPGKTVAVVGDGAVGLCGVIAAKRLGAERIILLGRHPVRIALGARIWRHRRGERARGRCRGARAPAHGQGTVLTRCWNVSGQAEAIETATSRSLVRAEPSAGVGVPQDAAMPGSRPAFYHNITVGGGPAPVRAYIPWEPLPDILEGRIQACRRVFEAPSWTSTVFPKVTAT